MQAFWIRATSAGQSLTFNLANRGLTTKPALARTANTTFEQVVLEVSNAHGDTDDALVYFRSEASSAYDLKYDAVQLPRDAGRPTLYTMADGKPLYLNALPELNSKMSIPLNFQAEQNGQHTISIKNSMSINPALSVLIEDKLMKTIKPLSLEDYSFNHNKDNAADRFILHFEYAAVGVEELQAEPFKAWVSQGVAHIRAFEHMGNTQIKIMDMGAKVLMNENASLNANEEMRIQLPSLKAGVYMFSIESASRSRVIKFVQQ